jgi:heme O synthase-like polyprenyltransferase
MPIFNGWIIRALAVRLRQPEMGPQRRFMLVVALVLALFLIGALWYLFQQPDDNALERAAIKVFAAMGVLIALLITAAVIVGKKTKARWTVEEALEMADRKDREKHRARPSK